MERLPPDAGTVCTALDLDAGYLADVFRKLASQALMTASVQMEDDIDERVRHSLDHATHLLLIAEAFEQEWERQEGSRDEAVERNGGDSLTPPPPPSQAESVAEAEA